MVVLALVRFNLSLTAIPRVYWGRGGEGVRKGEGRGREEKVKD